MLNFPLKNDYFKYFHESTGLRDNFFTSLLGGAFYNKSINVLELGTSRDIRNDARNGDGWSTLWWLTHVLCFGGKITVVDISNESIENCKDLTYGYENYIDYIVDNGEKYLYNKFSIIYLDGSDNPNDTLRQFEMCMNFDSVIVMDDFHTKGVLVWEKYKDKVKVFNCNGTHLMGYYKK